MKKYYYCFYLTGLLTFFVLICLLLTSCNIIGKVSDQKIKDDIQNFLCNFTDLKRQIYQWIRS